MKEKKMPKITSKGQITIPQEIRNRFGFLPGMDVEVIIEDSKALIVKSRRENQFMKWLGRGKKRNRQRIDHKIDQLRGRTDG
jgi:AbrB family looped-hinge helix DNA binding protein